jgi:serine O-acetyltransferase
MSSHELYSRQERHSDDGIRLAKPTPLWVTLMADVARFREEGHDLRLLLRGLLSQGFQALVVYRIFRWCYERGIPTQPIRFFVERLTEIVTGISLPAQAQIGKGLRIHHFGGIILHSEAIVGEGCTIYHGVTLGDRGGWGGAPRIGSHVIIGAGAKIIGNVTVGDYCRVGANAVVTTSVPDHCLAVGVPAVIKVKVPSSVQYSPPSKSCIP